MHLRVCWDASQRPLGELLGASGKLFGGFLEASWGLLGSLLEASWGLLGAPRGPPGGSWGNLGGKGSKCQFVFPLLGSLGALVGLSWAVLLAPGAVLEPSWAVLGPSWGPHGLSWDDLGGPLGRLRRCQDEKDEYAKIVRFPKGMLRFLLFGALEAVLWEHSWAVLGASWAVSKPSWTVVGLPWAISTLSWIVLALCLGPLGPSWGSV